MGVALVAGVVVVVLVGGVVVVAEQCLVPVVPQVDLASVGLVSDSSIASLPNGRSLRYPCGASRVRHAVLA
jgi:hypothetical protein